MTAQANIPRGNTFYGPTATITTTDYSASVHLEGAVAWFEDKNSAAPETLRSSRKVKCVLVRNVTGVTIYRGYLLQWATGYIGKRVDQFTATTATMAAGVVDEMYGSTGIRNGDLFWLCVEGPTLVYTPAVNTTFADSAAVTSWLPGDPLHTLTAAGSTATTTAGRPTKWGGTHNSTSDLTDGTATNKLANRVGYVLNAATTGYTSTATACTSAGTNRLVMIDLRLGSQFV